jgi:hypothetical protein
MLKRNAAHDADRDAELVRKRALWLNTILLSVGFGLCCGTALLFVTLLSIGVTREQAGLYLNLLGVFMPGYEASAAGAWIGFFWAFVYAAISGGVVYQVYIRAAGAKSGWAAGPGSSIFVTARLSGWALGLALGSLIAAQLFLSSAWLIVRGTADESAHAALLANYLPGYSVTWIGAAIGAVWLFGYALALSMLFARIYNTIAGMRSKGGRSNGGSN